jgi:integrase
MIPIEKTKNGEGHRLPLSPLAVSIIRHALALQSDQSGKTPWLFPAPRANLKGVRGPMTAHAASVALAQCLGKLGTERFRIHDLRRTAATRMAELGVHRRSAWSSIT